MKKIILFLGLFIYINAGLINGVAVVVGDEPITLLEIEKKKEAFGVSKDAAIKVLIDEKLKEKKIKDLGIDVDNYELEKRIELLAQQNNLSAKELKEVLEAKFMSWENYKSDVKKAVIDEKLSKIVLANELITVEEEDIRLYYSNNPKEFSQPKFIELIQYVSTSRRDLEIFMRNPMFLSENIIADEQSVTVANLNPKLAAILINVEEGTFSPIFPSGNRFFSILVKKRLGEVTKEYEKVKNRIRENLNNKNRTKAIESYFSKERDKVKITVIR